MRILPIVVAIVAGSAWADTPCACDVSKPETLAARQCSLCAEVEKHPADVAVVFVKDANPRKANRMLALPRKHTPGLHPMADLSDAERTVVFEAAIAKAKELWGAEWAIAYNGDHVRTQCHAHIHIGKLLPGVEAGTFVEVNSASEIPKPVIDGVWIHGAGNGKMHVHTGEQIAETVLLR